MLPPKLEKKADFYTFIKNPAKVSNLCRVGFSTSTDDILEDIAAESSHASLLTTRLRECNSTLDAVHKA
jgi:hypothetical protein